jgi:hypothetical protein
VTDKHNSSSLNIDHIKQVTDKHNDFLIDIRMTSFYYPGYAAFPESYDYDYQEEFSKVIEDFALFFRADMMYLMNGRYERFIAEKVDEDFTDLMLDPNLYHDHFIIVKPNRLAYKLFKKDILYVYEEDDHFLVASSPNAQRKFRKLRGIK